MNGVLESVHRDLPEHAGEDVLDARRQHGEPGARFRFVGEETAERHRLAEDRRRLRERQRCRRVDQALVAGQYLVDAVAELVGHRHHVAPPAREVQHDEGVQVRRPEGAVGAALLSLGDRRVDPRPAEEVFDDLAGARREAVVGGLDHLARAAPVDVPGDVLDGRVAVPLE